MRRSTGSTRLWDLCGANKVERARPTAARRSPRRRHGPNWGAEPMSAIFALDRPSVGVRQAVRAALPLTEALSADERQTIANSLVRIAHAARLLDQEARADG